MKIETQAKTNGEILSREVAQEILTSVINFVRQFPDVTKPDGIQEELGNMVSRALNPEDSDVRYLIDVEPHGQEVSVVKNPQINTDRFAQNQSTEANALKGLNFVGIRRLPIVSGREICHKLFLIVGKIKEEIICVAIDDIKSVGISEVPLKMPAAGA